MTKQELIEQHKQYLINENWDSELAQKEAERVYANFEEVAIAAVAVEAKPKTTRKKKEQE